MSTPTPPPAPRAPGPQLPLGVLLGLGALLLVGGILIGALVVMVINRASGPSVAEQGTVTPLALPTSVVVIPTVTPAPTSTETPEPTATEPEPTNTPVSEATPTETAEGADEDETPASEATAIGTAAAGSDQLVVDVGANVRSGPGTTYPVVANLAAGDTATVVGKDVSGTWFAIESNRTNSGVAWIAGLVATFDGDLDALPLVAAPPPPAASATPRPPAGGGGSPGGGGGPVAGSHGITGNLRLCNPGKTTYAANERICFVESIRNTTGAPVSYGILGVQASSLSGSGGQFQTSWSADLAPGGVLWIDPGCEGPTDRCNGPWEDGLRLATPGSYRLVLSVCFSAFGECLGASGDWENLSQPIVVNVQ